VTLVILAAGMGSRFGSAKQLAALGPSGATLLDYAIHDALRAGFARVVLVIRPELEQSFQAGVVARWQARITVELVHQPADPTRSKPWGTAHALLCAAQAVAEPFAMINADDFYGADSYSRLARFLDGIPSDQPEYAVVGFKLADTLSAGGGVNRALLRTDDSGRLTHIEEVICIEHSSAETFSVAGTTRLLPGDSLVSMNMWAFTPAIFSQLERGFAEFRKRAGHNLEFVLPRFVGSLLDGDVTRVRVLAGAGPWCGVTYEADRARVSAVLSELHSRGEYQLIAG
jgi:UTP-glucose-1-phosphate uridylyltransferase